MSSSILRLNYTTKCACGFSLKALIKKPTLMEDSHSKLTCRNCGSRFLLTLVRDKGETDRKWTSHIDALHLSAKAEDAIKARKTPPA